MITQATAELLMVALGVVMYIASNVARKKEEKEFLDFE